MLYTNIWCFFLGVINKSSLQTNTITINKLWFDTNLENSKHFELEKSLSVKSLSLDGRSWSLNCLRYRMAFWSKSWLQLKSSLWSLSFEMHYLNLTLQFSEAAVWNLIFIIRHISILFWSCKRKTETTNIAISNHFIPVVFAFLQQINVYYFKNFWHVGLKKELVDGDISYIPFISFLSYLTPSQL